MTGEEVMRRKGAKRIYPTTKSHSTSGDFDQVWQLGDEIYVVEAKGGSSGLGSRAIEGGRAEQGTHEYAESIAAAMIRSGDRGRAAGELVQWAIEERKLRYLMVRAPIGSSKGIESLRDFEVVEFILREP